MRRLKVWALVALLLAGCTPAGRVEVLGASSDAGLFVPSDAVYVGPMGGWDELWFEALAEPVPEPVAVAAPARPEVGMLPPRAPWDRSDPSAGYDLVAWALEVAAIEEGVNVALLYDICWCESEWRWWAINAGGDCGLGQHVTAWSWGWDVRARAAGFEGVPCTDVWANAKVSARLLREQGTAPWRPSRPCWSGKHPHRFNG